MIKARTLKTTYHGNPGERRALPAGLVIEVRSVTNLPGRSSKIKWWAFPLPGLKSFWWPLETIEWANGPGIGLETGDIEIIGETPIPVIVYCQHTWTCPTCGSVNNVSSPPYYRDDPLVECPDCGVEVKVIDED